MNTRTRDAGLSINLRLRIQTSTLPQSCFEKQPTAQGEGRWAQILMSKVGFLKKQSTGYNSSVAHMLTSEPKSHSTVTIRFIQLAKVIAHGGESQRDGNSIAMLDQRLAEEAPEFPALAIKHAQLDCDSGKSRDSTNQIETIRLVKILCRSFQRIERSLVVLAGLVNRAHD